MLRLGTRASALAQWQANWVAAALRDRNVDVEIVLISTQGDRRQDPLANIGGQGLFTKEIQRALLDDEVDLAVHSLKDLPTDPTPGLALTAVPERENVGDVMVCNQHPSFADLPEQARVGTGSARRKAQLLHHRPDLKVEDIRGNVDTRLKKLDDGDYDAIILAEAGLKRLGWEQRIAEILDKEWMLPAVGQGALGLETRAEETDATDAVGLLDDPVTHAAVVAERTMLYSLRGGCMAPVGAWARLIDDQLQLEACVLSEDGKQRLYHRDSCDSPTDLAAAAELGATVAQALHDQGAGELIAAARQDP